MHSLVTSNFTIKICSFFKVAYCLISLTPLPDHVEKEQVTTNSFKPIGRLNGKVALKHDGFGKFDTLESRKTLFTIKLKPNQ